VENSVKVIQARDKTRKIIIRAAQSNLALVKMVPGVRYDQALNIWHTPVSDAAIEHVSRRLLAFDFDDSFTIAARGTAAAKRAATQAAKRNTRQPDRRRHDSWDHQAAGYNFVIGRIDAGHTSAMLAMDMGTGKTKVAIDLFSNTTEPGDVVVIVCPLAVVPVWPLQFEKWGIESDRWHVLALDNGATKDRASAIKRVVSSGGYDRLAIVLNYDAVPADVMADTLATIPRATGRPISWLVADESHKIKAHQGKRNKAVTKLGRQAGYRLALTGTPMDHSPLDIFAQARFLDERIFGPYWTPFKKRYAVQNTIAGSKYERVIGYQREDELADVCDTFMYLVKSEDVQDLPAVEHVERFCTLEPAAMRVYRQFEAELFAEWESDQISADNALVKILRLQQMAGGTTVNDDGESIRISTAKASALQETIDDISTSEPIVVFAQFSAEIADIHEAAAKNGRTSYELSGKRKELKAWQQATGGEVLAIQIQSGAEGIDLTRARYQIYQSTGYRLGPYEQSLKRIHRPGQTRPVTIIHILAKATKDIEIQRSLRDGKATIEAILGYRRGHEDDV